LLSTCALAGENVPFQLRNGYLIVAKCSVADTDLIAVIDTGVSETVIDIGLARRLHLPMHHDSAVFLTSEGAVQAVSIPSLHFGPLQAESLAGIAVDLSKLNRDFGFHADLLIGMDLLRRSDFTIDYKSRLLTFGSVPPMPHVAPLSQNARLALIASIVSGRKMHLQVDTGFNGLLVYADHFRLAEVSNEIGTHLVGVAQTTSVRSGDLDIQLANCRKKKMAASFVENSSGISEFDGVLGARTFAKHRVGFDFERMVLAWE
jgi:predicted aspartyl protease